MAEIESEGSPVEIPKVDSDDSSKESDTQQESLTTSINTLEDLFRLVDDDLLTQELHHESERNEEPSPYIQSRLGKVRERLLSISSGAKEKSTQLGGAVLSAAGSGTSKAKDALSSTAQSIGQGVQTGAERAVDAVGSVTGAAVTHTKEGVGVVGSFVTEKVGKTKEGLQTFLELSQQGADTPLVLYNLYTDYLQQQPKIEDIPGRMRVVLDEEGFRNYLVTRMNEFSQRWYSSKQEYERLMKLAKNESGLLQLVHSTILNIDANAQLSDEEKTQYPYTAAMTAYISRKFVTDTFKTVGKAAAIGKLTVVSGGVVGGLLTAAQIVDELRDTFGRDLRKEELERVTQSISGIMIGGNADDPRGKMMTPQMIASKKDAFFTLAGAGVSMVKNIHKRSNTI